MQNAFGISARFATHEKKGTLLLGRDVPGASATSRGIG
jgi:hypothetical protein